MDGLDVPQHVLLPREAPSADGTGGVLRGAEMHKLNMTPCTIVGLDDAVARKALPVLLVPQAELQQVLVLGACVSTGS